jgi:hypothetical protein
MSEKVTLEHGRKIIIEELAKIVQIPANENITARDYIARFPVMLSVTKIRDTVYAIQKDGYSANSVGGVSK